MIEHKVIGNTDKFTLAIGKYAFTPCDYIPKEYLESLVNSNISDKDRVVIAGYLQKLEDTELDKLNRDI